MRKLFLLTIASLLVSTAKTQVKTPTLYVAGTVLSEEKMLVSVAGTKTIEGNVVSAEINGKKAEAKTDKDGHALLDFMSIAGNVTEPLKVVINSFDKNGKLISSENTTVYKGRPNTDPPYIAELPNNLPKGEVLTIPGNHLGSEAKFMIGDLPQETLAASDEEMVVKPESKVGDHNVYVKTPNGATQTQNVNFYSLDFVLAKNSISPGENVQAQVRYESIPVGTKLIFTNKSTEIINMMIPGGQTGGSVSTYTVPEINGSFPVNITGINRGNFVIALDFGFKEEPEVKELKNSLSKMTDREQKMLYGYFSPEAKCALWKDRLNESLKMPLKSNQKEILQELSTHLKPEIFEKTVAATEFNSYAPLWYTRAKTFFTGTDEAKLYDIVMTLGGAKTNAPIAGGNIPDCDCVKADGDGPPNCPISFKCKTRNCRTNWCGLFWRLTCDGQCI